MSLSLVLPEPPSANKWWRRAGTHMHLSNEARAYKLLVATLAKRKSPKFPEGPVSVTLHWDRGRKSGDLDKRLGVVLDALQGVAYANDNQIVKIVATRGDDKANPKLYVTVEAM